jgi:hypothetical protein
MNHIKRCIKNDKMHLINGTQQVPENSAENYFHYLLHKMLLLQNIELVPQ